ncbi:MAG: patatin-like phospholipase family protein [Deinococcales bacterium]
MLESNVFTQLHHPKSYDLVLQGGGVRAIALVGALAALESQGYKMQRAVGTSGGAVVGALHAAGYTAKELHKIIKHFNFACLKDSDWVDRIPYLGKALNILFSKGIYEGDVLFNWLEEMFHAKGVKTFGDLKNHDLADQEGLVSNYRMQVVVSDISRKEILVLPRDAHKLGVNPDELSVPLVMRMSASIPIFFEPVVFKNPQTGTEHVLVDGAMLSNFPVWFFDRKKPRWPTFGLMLLDSDPNDTTVEHVNAEACKDAEIKSRYGLVSYLKDLVQTMMEAHDRLHLERSNLARTITIPTLGIHLTQFDLPKDCIDALYQSGFDSAERFLKNWDFDSYVRDYRQEYDLFNDLLIDAPITPLQTDRELASVF